MSEVDAALYEAPFKWVLEHVKPERDKNNREAYRKFWWRHAEARPGMRLELKPLKRYIATPGVAKHRLFSRCTFCLRRYQVRVRSALEEDAPKTARP